jgi:hypothetical protein
MSPETDPPELVTLNKVLIPAMPFEEARDSDDGQQGSGGNDRSAKGLEVRYAARPSFPLQFAVTASGASSQTPWSIRVIDSRHVSSTRW